MKICSVDWCNSSVKSRGLCSRHYERFRTGKEIEGEETRRTRGEGSINTQGYIVKDVDGTAEYEHRMIAAVAIDRLLKGEECVHHVDENRANNTNTNLVICPDRAYHQLLHRRTRALDTCGHADWLRCKICGTYSAPIDPDMWQSPTTADAQHRSCNAARIKELRARQNGTI